ncbi:MAG: hypothetical protein HPY50_06640 [Firmicutes bacterium]|nr:hypothetical protein [Bacillota bacterium]
MQIDICKWYNDAASPVVFMIDDLCNVWVDTNANGIIDEGEDWGYAKRGPGSSLVFLEERIMKNFPQLKVTFFIPVGVRAGVIKESETGMKSEMINSDPETREFFKSIGEDDRYEAAFHGTDHGIPGEKAADFIHEWEAYKTLDEALTTIKKGKEVFREVFGHYPRGGKYCGYKKNSFSDKSIDLSGFKWWCRYSPGHYGRGNDAGGEVDYFGTASVIDIPTTVYGSLLNTIVYPGPLGVKSIIKRLCKKPLIRYKLAIIDDLIKRRMVVSIQEHIAPSRNDGRRQPDNIFDDLESITAILKHLERKNAWYCTCSELADYVYARDNTAIDFDADKKGITLSGPEEIIEKEITLKIGPAAVDKLIQPDGAVKPVEKGLVNVEIMPGTYFLG